MTDSIGFVRVCMHRNVLEKSKFLKVKIKISNRVELLFLRKQKKIEKFGIENGNKFMEKVKKKYNIYSPELFCSHFIEFKRVNQMHN